MSYPAPWHWPGDDDSYPGYDTYVQDRIARRIPPDLMSGSVTGSTLKALGKELYALYELLRATQERHFPPLSDSVGLALWEQILDLPVDPVGVSLTDRRNRIQSKLISRFQFYGKDLRAGIELIAGPIAGTTVDHVTGTVTIELTGVATQYAVNEVEKYCIESGPAHIQWIIISPSAASAFIVGISKAGDSL